MLPHGHTYTGSLDGGKKAPFSALVRKHTHTHALWFSSIDVTRKEHSHPQTQPAQGTIQLEVKQTQCGIDAGSGGSMRVGGMDRIFDVSCPRCIASSIAARCIAGSITARNRLRMSEPRRHRQHNDEQ